MARTVGMPKELGMGYQKGVSVEGDDLYKSVAAKWDLFAKPKLSKRALKEAATRPGLFRSASGIAMHAHGAMYAKPDYVVTPTGRLVWPDKVRQESLIRALEAGHRLGKNGISFETHED